MTKDVGTRVSDNDLQASCNCGPECDIGGFGESGIVSMARGAIYGLGGLVFGTTVGVVAGELANEYILETTSQVARYAVDIGTGLVGAAGGAWTGLTWGINR